MHAYKEGQRLHAAPMELAAGMSDADIRNISGYYASLPKLSAAPAASAYQPGDSSYHEGGQTAAACTKCHGENGYSQEPGVPSLAGQQPAYLIIATQEYSNGSRPHAKKDAMLKALAQVDVEKMAMYFAAQVPPVRQPPSFGDVKRGETLTASCAECHGPQGISHDPLVPSLAGQEPVYLVNALKAYRDQVRKHEVMAIDMNDSAIEDVAAYYSVQQLQAAVDKNLAVQELVTKCDRCHGPALSNSRMVVPGLNGQNKEYLVKVMKAYRDFDRGSSLMHKMSADYSDETIEALASYFSSQPAN
jgi:cytochrome c553